MILEKIQIHQDKEGIYPALSHISLHLFIQNFKHLALRALPSVPCAPPTALFPPRLAPCAQLSALRPQRSAHSPLPPALIIKRRNS